MTTFLDVILDLKHPGPALQLYPYPDTRNEFQLLGLLQFMSSWMGFSGPKEAWAPPVADQDDEARELHELHEMLGKPEGALPRGVFVKLQVAHENRVKAKEVRAESQEAMKQLEARAMEQTDRLQRLRNQIKHDKDVVAIEATRQIKAENAREMRREEQERLEQREAERQRTIAIAVPARQSNHGLAEQRLIWHLRLGLLLWTENTRDGGARAGCAARCA